MRLSMGVFLILAMLATPVVAQNVVPDAGRMDEIIQSEVSSGGFMGSVLVAKDGTVLLDKGYGAANIEWNQPNDGDTKFRIGSLSKQFTAVAILILNERGQINLDAPVKTYLQDAPAAWDAVTVRHLLTHTSGIANFTGFEDYESKKRLPATIDSVMARFRDLPLTFVPGEKWDYSNSGYVVLSAIIEKVSGQSYAEFVTETIFKPLGMTDSGYDSFVAILPRRATGYMPSPNGPVHADFIDMSVTQGAGGLYSTTHDLLKWQSGLYGGKLLKPDTLKVYATPVMNNYALDVLVVTEGGKTTISHAGGIEGFNTWLSYDPDSRISVIVLGNLTGMAPVRLGGLLMAVSRGETVVLQSERQAITLPEAELKSYEGVYALSPEFSLTFAYTEGALRVQPTGQPAAEVFAEAKDKFFVTIIDAQITFTRDASGQIVGLILHQSGQNIPAPKKMD